jgi:hypothetical protein
MSLCPCNHPQRSMIVVLMWSGSIVSTACLKIIPVKLKVLWKAIRYSAALVEFLTSTWQRKLCLSVKHPDDIMIRNDPWRWWCPTNVIGIYERTRSIRNILLCLLDWISRRWLGWRRILRYYVCDPTVALLIQLILDPTYVLWFIPNRNINKMTNKEIYDLAVPYKESKTAKILEEFQWYWEESL